MLKKSLQYGAMAGIGTVVYLLLFYAFQPRLMLNPWVLWGSTVIFIVFMVMACRYEKGQTEGRYPLQAALRSAFSVYVVGSAIYYIFYFLLFNVFDPDLIELQRTLLLENLDQYENVLGEENAEEIRRNYQEESLEVRPGDTLLDFARGLIGGFIISLAVAGVTHRG